jgi:hypothetical protein
MTRRRSRARYPGTSLVADDDLSRIGRYVSGSATTEKITE